MTPADCLAVRSLCVSRFSNVYINVYIFIYQEYQLKPGSLLPAYNGLLRTVAEGAMEGVFILEI